jgi:hypothetical protein
MRLTITIDNVEPRTLSGALALATTLDLIIQEKWGAPRVTDQVYEIKSSLPVRYFLTNDDEKIA